MNIKEVERAAKKIQAALFKNSNSVAIGQLRSHFKGSGLTFKEHQVYTFGDDVKFIDWKILAKTDTPFIKNFEEERNVDIVIVVDAGLSMMVGYNDISKLQATIEIAALLYLLSGETGDNIEVIIIGEKTTVVKKSRGHVGLINFVAQLEDLEILDSLGKVRLDNRPVKIQSETEIKKILQKYLMSRKEVIILSDFCNFISPKNLKSFMARKNLHVVQVSAPLDEAQELPFSIYGLSINAKREVEKNIFSVRSSVPPDSWSKKLGKRYKKINVDKKYLEDFVKEMV